MMMSAIRPDLPGPIMLAGSPLSYWAGVHGKNPMRYLGGLLGGTWLTALAGDLGHGIFDGANLVANFESLHPDNTYWKKIYNVYSKIDTEAARFLDFEKWWGSPVLLNCRGDAVDRRRSVRRQQARVGRIAHLDRRAGRSAQHPVADHRVLLLGRRHHAAAAGAGLDPRSLRPRGRDRRGRADHRLLPASEHRPSRHLRFRQGGDKGTRRIRPGDGHDRRHAAGSLRGRHHRRRRNGRTIPSWSSGDYLFTAGGAHAGRHPGAGRQQPRGRAALRRGGPGFRNQQGPLPDLCRPDGQHGGNRTERRRAARPAPEPAALSDVRRQQSADAAGRWLGRAGARQPPPGRRRQPVSGRRADDVGLDRRRARSLGQGARQLRRRRFFSILYGAPWLQADGRAGGR